MAVKIYQAGETAVLTTQNKVDGVLTDADGSMKVAIWDPTGAAELAATAMVNDGTGLYHYDHATAAGDPRGVYTIEYIAVHTGVAPAARTSIVEDVFILEGAVTVAAMKDWLRIEQEQTEDDIDLARLITAATEYCENYTNRQIVTRSRTENWDDFPGDRFTLPYPPLQSVATIKYYTSAGVQTTVGGAVYGYDTTVEPGLVYLKYGQSWPTNRGHYNDIEVIYVAGYGDAAAIPERFRTAIKLLVAHWYEHREAATDGFVPKSIPMGVDSLLWSLAMPGADS